MKRNITRGMLATGLPIVILFGGYHLTYQVGRLTNHIISSIWGYKLDIHLPLVGIFGLCLLAVALFFLAVIAKVLWFWAGKIMDKYEREMQIRARRRERERSEQPERRPLPGGEALQHPVGDIFPVHEPLTTRRERIRQLLQADVRSTLEEMDEDRQYRQRIGVEE